MSFPQPTKIIPHKTLGPLSKTKLDSEGKVSPFKHFSQFLLKCNAHKVTNPSGVCGLFPSPSKVGLIVGSKDFQSIIFTHGISFLNSYLITFWKYDYNELCYEINDL